MIKCHEPDIVPLFPVSVRRLVGEIFVFLTGVYKKQSSEKMGTREERMFGRSFMYNKKEVIPGLFLMVPKK